MKRHTLNIRKDDTIVVLSGKDKNKKGKVLRVVPEDDKVIVQGIHMIKKHQRPSASVREGGIVEREAPLYASKVMVVCPNCGEPTRVAHKRVEGGKSVRVCKKCGELIDKV
jgi:large subunit ribosomal protein L24|uniref:Large ribosomal subunit protein uL24 n=1 Tax=Mesoaciditoga lauensis TaxID=1495039 RepID=A0A7V3VT44_9BACT